MVVEQRGNLDVTDGRRNSRIVSGWFDPDFGTVLWQHRMNPQEELPAAERPAPRA